MSLSADKVEKLAEMAQLQLDDAAIEDYATQLANIESVISRLGEVETKGVEPMLQPLAATARLRPDQAQACVDREAFQALAPDTADGLYRVPKVIE